MSDIKAPKAGNSSPYPRVLPQVHFQLGLATDLECTPWQEGESTTYEGRVFTEPETSSTLDLWLTLGKEGGDFQIQSSSLLEVRHRLIVNSGSSAKLFTIPALTLSKPPTTLLFIHGNDEP